MKPLSFLLTILSISIVTALAFVGYRTLLAHSTSPDYAMEAQDTSGRGPVRMIRFVLLDDGIYPRSMRIDQGLVNIALEDRTNRSEGLVIESVVGEQRNRVTQVRRAPQHWRGRELIRLTAGRYLISDASQPDHRAEMTVSP